jgi:small-conductance mechanosensitive channel
VKDGLFAGLAARVVDAVGWPPDGSRPWVVGTLAAAMVLLVTVVIGWLLKNVVVGALRRLTAKTVTNLDDEILALAERPMLRLVTMVGIYVAASDLPLPGPWETTLTGILLILLVLVAIRVATKIAVVLLIAYGAKVSDDIGKDRYQKDYVPLLSKIAGTVFVFFGLVVVLRHFGQDVSSLVAALGIGGLAISFAAKDTLGNMFAGFTILLDRPFRPGDRIRLASGEVGDVVDVGTRSTRVKLLDQNMLIVPNSELVQTRVVNYNFPSHATRAQLDVGIAYGSDVERAKAIVLAAIQAERDVAEPAVLVAGFGESALNLSATYTIAEFATTGPIQDRVRTRVYTEFLKAGIKIPYPTRELIVQAGTPPA